MGAHRWRRENGRNVAATMYEARWTSRYDAMDFPTWVTRVADGTFTPELGPVR
jgi:hypothetical protein